jgi:HrpA-like RNA helicase
MIDIKVYSFSKWHVDVMNHFLSTYRLNVQLGVGVLDNHWVSQANVNQRRGRAGRVRPGECYHMYSRDTYDALMKFPIPEVLRVPLEKTVLDCKVSLLT